MTLAQTTTIATAFWAQPCELSYSRNEVFNRGIYMCTYTSIYVYVYHYVCVMCATYAEREHTFFSLSAC